jgi:hypothetical protein
MDRHRRWSWSLIAPLPCRDGILFHRGIRYVCRQANWTPGHTTKALTGPGRHTRPRAWRYDHPQRTWQYEGRMVRRSGGESPLCPPPDGRLCPAHGGPSSLV